MIDEDTEERIGILAEANKISQDAAERLHAAALDRARRRLAEQSTNPFANVADRLKSALRGSKMRRVGNRHDGKALAAGE